MTFTFYLGTHHPASAAGAGMEAVDVPVGTLEPFWCAKCLERRRA